MTLTPFQTLMIILSVALGTIITRAVPFIVFPENKEPPKFINYLSSVLPAATMGLLVVYCLKNVSVLSYPFGLPELIEIAVIVILHLWRKNVLLSIISGTAVYMLLVQLVF